jgi:hypothetical protein
MLMSIEDKNRLQSENWQIDQRKVDSIFYRFKILNSGRPFLAPDIVKGRL